VPREYGLHGLRRVELVFANLSRERMTGGVMTADGDPAPASPQVPDRQRNLASDPDCQAIGPALRALGLEVVEHCGNGDAACGTLRLTLETSPPGELVNGCTSP